MHYIEELEFQNFLEDFKRGLSHEHSNNYLDVYDYEDEFSHNEINKYQTNLAKRIKEFLKKENISNYKVYNDWCVHVIDKKLFNNITEVGKIDI